MKRVVFILLIFSFSFLYLNSQDFETAYLEGIIEMETQNFIWELFDNFLFHFEKGSESGIINENTKYLEYSFTHTFIDPKYKRFILKAILDGTEKTIKELKMLPFKIVKYKDIGYNKTKFFIKIDFEEYKKIQREAKEEKERLEREAKKKAKEKEIEGENYYNIGEYDKAISSLFQAISLNTNSQKSYFLLGKSYYHNKEYDSAENYLYRALNFNTNDTSILYYIGLSHFNQKEYDESIDIFNKINKSEPKNIEVLYMLAGSYYNNGYKKEAINNFSKYIEIDKNNDNAYYWLGKSYNDIGDIEKAEEFYLRGLEVNSQNANILYALGELNSSIGNKKEAKEYYQKTLAVDPNHNLSKTKLDSIIMEENIKIRNEKIQKLNSQLNTVKKFKTAGTVFMVGGIATTISPFVIQYFKNGSSFNIDFLKKNDNDSKLYTALFYTGIGIFGAGLITTMVTSFRIDSLEKQISYAFVPIINKNEYGIMDYGYAFNFSYKF